MVESMIKLPDDMFRHELLQFLTVHDIVNLDSACMNYDHRPQLMEKICGVILRGDKDQSMKPSLFKWLGMRRIYLIEMQISLSSTPAFTENDYVDQFRFIQHVVMRGFIRDDMAIFIISHCPSLLSIDIFGAITDRTLKSIAEHCTGLQTLSLSYCKEITDSGLITISEHCPNLKSLEVGSCDQITDGSIISISTHCAGLQLLNLRGCSQITNVSIISISTHCTGLQSLSLNCCHQITDVSIISISTHCTGLESLDLWRCHQIADACIISISENCTMLKELDVAETAITDASLIVIAKNCSGLQSLSTYKCNGLSSHELRRHYFKSVSELRAVLLSIYPSLPI